MAGTRKRLEALTSDLMQSTPNLVLDPKQAATGSGSTVQSMDVETGFPPQDNVRGVRTGPGQMLMFRSQMLAAEGELAAAKERLEQFQEALPTRRLDPKTVVAGKWANRHTASFSTPEFARLKGDIESAGGNVQPILVREVGGSSGTFEIIFGHRRHRACLDLGVPVLAAIWTQALPEAELFAMMDRENRERADLSPYEQGMMYQRAIDEHLFPSVRRLAEAIGVSHTWVRKAMGVCQLPAPVVECFSSPIEIQHRHAEQIGTALEHDRKAVLKRAERIRGKSLAAADVVARLCGSPRFERTPSEQVKVEGNAVGRWRVLPNGSVSITLDANVLSRDQLETMLARLQSAKGG